MLSGRLGLEDARVPHADRHGLLWLARGKLLVDNGTLRFLTAGGPSLEAGAYAIPYQTVSAIVLEPGTTLTHDVLRLMARHGTGLFAVGEGGVRFYASLVPHGPDDSARARRQAEAWADDDKRRNMARRMYAIRLGEVFPNAAIEVMRGLEGARAKEAYKRIAMEFGVPWRGRRYDRNEPGKADPPNQAINHAVSATLGAARLAVASVGALAPLGFIHEASGMAFCLDIADLFRDVYTLPVAFGGVKESYKRGGADLEQCVRHLAAKSFRKRKLVAEMIDKIKALLDEPEGGEA